MCCRTGARSCGAGAYPARERADALAQLQNAGPAEGHVVVRPVTELPVDLPSLITRLRDDGSLLDDRNQRDDENCHDLPLAFENQSATTQAR